MRTVECEEWQKERFNERKRKLYPYLGKSHLACTTATTAHSALDLLGKMGTVGISISENDTINVEGDFPVRKIDQDEWATRLEAITTI